MSEVRLVNIKKVYPFSGDEKKKKKFLKKEVEKNPETNKPNLQITEEGVVASQTFLRQEWDMRSMSLLFTHLLITMQLPITE